MSNINSYKDFITEQLKIQRNSTLSRAEPIAEPSTLEEGNPLSRFHELQQRGHHTIVVSTDRQDASAEANKANREKLKDYLRTNKIGHRPVEGSWDEGGGVGKEQSFHIIASKPGEEGAAELRKHAEAITKMSTPNQDAYLEADPKGTGAAKYTRDAGNRKKGDVDEFGPVRYNVNNKYGETRYYPRRKTGPKFTYKEKKTGLEKISQTEDNPD